MVAICLYFQLHQPFRLKRYRVFDMGKEHSYFDEEVNHSIMHRQASQVYLPVNQQLLRLLGEYDHLEMTFSLSGTALEQMVRYAPAVLRSFRRLADTGKVSFTGETYYHSLSGSCSLEEFERQISKHKELLMKYLGVTPRLFRNTQYALSMDQLDIIRRQGFRGVVYESRDAQQPRQYHGLVCLPLHQHLSAYLSGQHHDASASAKAFANQIAGMPDESVHLHADYGWFADLHHTKFFETLLQEISGYEQITFSSGEAVSAYLAEQLINETPPKQPSLLEVQHPWMHNEMQQQALQRLYALESKVKAQGESRLLDTWARLTASDHLFYMCTDDWTEDSPARRASIFESPYEGFLYFMNVLGDLERQCRKNDPVSQDSRQYVSSV